MKERIWNKKISKQALLDFLSKGLHDHCKYVITWNEGADGVERHTITTIDPAENNLAKCESCGLLGFLKSGLCRSCRDAGK